MNALKTSLRARLLTYLLLLSILPLAAVGTIAYETSRQGVISRVEAQLDGVASMKEAEVRNWISRTKDTVLWLADRPRFQEAASVVAAAAPGAAGRLAAYEIVTEELRALPALHDIRSASLIDAAGGVIIASSDRDQEGTRMSASDYFIEGRNGLYTSEMFAIEGSGLPTMVIATPVRDGTGRVVGVLAANANLRRLNDIMRERPGLGRTGESLLVNRSNLLVTDSHFEPGSAFQKRIFGEGAIRALGGETGVGLFVDYRGKPVIGAYRWMEQEKLALIAKQDQSEAFRLLPFIRNVIAGMTAVVALTAALVCFRLSRSITRPVQDLVRGAREIAGGNLGYQVATANNDEVGQLSAAFNQMARAIEESDRKLKLSEALYRSIFEHAGEAITVSREQMVDGELQPGAIEAWNPAAEKLFGWTAQEMVGQTSERTIPPELRGGNAIRQSLKEIVERQGGVIKYELPRLRKDGARIDVITTRNLIKGEDGSIRSVAVFTDITELRQAQEKLLTLERLATLGQFSGSVSHELRNPLGVIDGSAFYLKAKLKDADEKVKQHLERISASVSHSNAIIEALLDLTRMKEPRLHPLDLRTMLSEAIATARLPATVTVVKDFPVEEVLVAGDSELLRMAFKNITRNAAEAMENHGTITIRLSTANGLTEVSFTDTGPGIPPENLERVFQPLFTTKLKGIGFGLAITQMVIEKHGGTIAARSEVGKGATFVIRLPAYIGEQPPREASSGLPT